MRSHISPFQEVQTFLRQEFRNVLPHIFATEREQRAIEIALSAPGKLFYEQSDKNVSGIWSLLPYLLACDLSALAPLATVTMVYARMALAVESLLCALDIMDDIEDGDESEIIQLFGRQGALDIALRLQMVVCPALLHSLQELFVPESMIFRLQQQVSMSVLSAAGGQHLDLLSERQTFTETSESFYIQMVAAKSGALASCACSLAALSSGIEQEEQLQLVARLGTLLGIWQQIRNDSRDYQQPAQKSDILRGKKTLPVIIAHQLTSSDLPAAELTQHVLRRCQTREHYFQQQVYTSIQNIEDSTGKQFSSALRLLLGVPLKNN
ncbi:polyprenyl synthetase family protein [Dictyobacter arantiisoli]|uniref:Polyprenyl synthetase n=1 Tax=Dictyobacter arantiisoli TaxID=2014874 RepID=A0A5A5TE88_9CHLR|nr:polyprenyl synthetase family protein [Dictyobacter arantiisoli]GCF09558.1 hypothetical protein KDI_31220 [Dictyobacter arantiisoli]